MSDHASSRKLYFLFAEPLGSENDFINILNIQQEQSSIISAVCNSRAPFKFKIATGTRRHIREAVEEGAGILHLSCHVAKERDSWRIILEDEALQPIKLDIESLNAFLDSCIKHVNKHGNNSNSTELISPLPTTSSSDTAGLSHTPQPTTHNIPSDKSTSDEDISVPLSSLHLSKPPDAPKHPFPTAFPFPTAGGTLFPPVLTSMASDTDAFINIPSQSANNGSVTPIPTAPALPPLGSSHSQRRPSISPLSTVQASSYAHTKSMSPFSPTPPATSLPFSVVVLNACYSQSFAACFLSRGVKHVICYPDTERLPDDVAVRFSSLFYRYLLRGSSVQSAFDRAQTDVWDTTSPTRDVASFVLLPRDAMRLHTSVPFPLLPLPLGRAGSMPQAAMLPPRPSPIENIRADPVAVGCVSALSSLMKALKTGRQHLFIISGIPGVGKTRTAQIAAQMLHWRCLVRGIHTVDIRGIITTVAQRYEDHVQKHRGKAASPQRLRAFVVSALLTELSGALHYFGVTLESMDDAVNMFHDYRTLGQLTDPGKTDRSGKKENSGRSTVFTDSEEDVSDSGGENSDGNHATGEHGHDESVGDGDGVSVGVDGNAVMTRERDGKKKEKEKEKKKDRKSKKKSEKDKRAKDSNSNPRDDNDDDDDVEDDVSDVNFNDPYLRKSILHLAKNEVLPLLILEHASDLAQLATHIDASFLIEPIMDLFSKLLNSRAPFANIIVAGVMPGIERYDHHYVTVEPLSPSLSLTLLVKLMDPHRVEVLAGKLARCYSPADAELALRTYFEAHPLAQQFTASPLYVKAMVRALSHYDTVEEAWADVKASNLDKDIVEKDDALAFMCSHMKENPFSRYQSQFASQRTSGMHSPVPPAGGSAQPLTQHHALTAPVGAGAGGVGAGVHGALPGAPQLTMAGHMGGLTGAGAGMSAQPLAGALVPAPGAMVPAPGSLMFPDGVMGTQGAMVPAPGALVPVSGAGPPGGYPYPGTYPLQQQQQHMQPSYGPQYPSAYGMPHAQGHAQMPMQSPMQGQMGQGMPPLLQQQQQQQQRQMGPHGYPTGLQPYSGPSGPLSNPSAASTGHYAPSGASSVPPAGPYAPAGPYGPSGPPSGPYNPSAPSSSPYNPSGPPSGASSLPYSSPGPSAAYPTPSSAYPSPSAPPAASPGHPASSVYAGHPAGYPSGAYPFPSPPSHYNAPQLPAPQQQRPPGAQGSGQAHTQPPGQGSEQGPGYGYGRPSLLHPAQTTPPYASPLIAPHPPSHAPSQAPSHFSLASSRASLGPTHAPSPLASTTNTASTSTSASAAVPSQRVPAPALPCYAPPAPTTAATCPPATGALTHAPREDASTTGTASPSVRAQLLRHAMSLGTQPQLSTPSTDVSTADSAVSAPAPHSGLPPTYPSPSPALAAALAFTANAAARAFAQGYSTPATPATSASAAAPAAGGAGVGAGAGAGVGMGMGTASPPGGPYASTQPSHAQTAAAQLTRPSSYSQPPSYPSQRPQHPQQHPQHPQQQSVASSLYPDDADDIAAPRRGSYPPFAASEAGKASISAPHGGPLPLPHSPTHTHVQSQGLSHSYSHSHPSAQPHTHAHSQPQSQSSSGLHPAYSHSQHSNAPSLSPTPPFAPAHAASPAAASATTSASPLPPTRPDFAMAGTLARPRNPSTSATGFVSSPQPPMHPQASDTHTHALSHTLSHASSGPPPSRAHAAVSLAPLSQDVYTPTPADTHVPIPSLTSASPAVIPCPHALATEAPLPSRFSSHTAPSPADVISPSPPTALSQPGELAPTTATGTQAIGIGRKPIAGSPGPYPIASQPTSVPDAEAEAEDRYTLPLQPHQPHASLGMSVLSALSARSNAPSVISALSPAAMPATYPTAHTHTNTNASSNSNTLPTSYPSPAVLPAAFPSPYPSLARSDISDAPSDNSDIMLAPAVAAAKAPSSRVSFASEATQIPLLPCPRLDALGLDEEPSQQSSFDGSPLLEPLRVAADEHMNEDVTGEHVRGDEESLLESNTARAHAASHVEAVVETETETETEAEAGAGAGADALVLLSPLQPIPSLAPLPTPALHTHAPTPTLAPAPAPVPVPVSALGPSSLLPGLPHDVAVPDHDQVSPPCDLTTPEKPRVPPAHPNSHPHAHPHARAHAHGRVGAHPHADAEEDDLILIPPPGGHRRASTVSAFSPSFAHAPTRTPPLVSKTVSAPYAAPTDACSPALSQQYTASPQHADAAYGREDAVYGHAGDGYALFGRVRGRTQQYATAPTPWPTEDAAVCDLASADEQCGEAAETRGHDGWDGDLAGEREAWRRTEEGVVGEREGDYAERHGEQHHDALAAHTAMGREEAKRTEEEKRLERERSTASATHAQAYGAEGYAEDVRLATATTTTTVVPAPVGAGAGAGAGNACVPRRREEEVEAHVHDVPRALPLPHDMHAVGAADTSASTATGTSTAATAAGAGAGAGAGVGVGMGATEIPHPARDSVLRHLTDEASTLRPLSASAAGSHPRTSRGGVGIEKPPLAAVDSPMPPASFPPLHPSHLLLSQSNTSAAGSYLSHHSHPGDNADMVVLSVAPSPFASGAASPTHTVSSLITPGAAAFPPDTLTALRAAGTGLAASRSPSLASIPLAHASITLMRTGTTGSSDTPSLHTSTSRANIAQDAAVLLSNRGRWSTTSKPGDTWSLGAPHAEDVVPVPSLVVSATPVIPLPTRRQDVDMGASPGLYTTQRHSRDYSVASQHGMPLHGGVASQGVVTVKASLEEFHKQITSVGSVSADARERRKDGDYDFSPIIARPAREREWDERESNLYRPSGYSSTQASYPTTTSTTTSASATAVVHAPAHAASAVQPPSAPTVPPTPATQSYAPWPVTAAPAPAPAHGHGPPSYTVAAAAPAPAQPAQPYSAGAYPYQHPGSAYTLPTPPHAHAAAPYTQQWGPNGPAAGPPAGYNGYGPWGGQQGWTPAAGTPPGQWGGNAPPANQWPPQAQPPAQAWGPGYHQHPHQWQQGQPPAQPPYGWQQGQQQQWQQQPPQQWGSPGNAPPWGQQGPPPQGQWGPGGPSSAWGASPASWQGHPGQQWGPNWQGATPNAWQQSPQQPQQPWGVPPPSAAPPGAPPAWGAPMQGQWGPNGQWLQPPNSPQGPPSWTPQSQPPGNQYGYFNAAPGPYAQQYPPPRVADAAEIPRTTLAAMQEVIDSMHRDLTEIGMPPSAAAVAAAAAANAVSRGQVRLEQLQYRHQQQLQLHHHQQQQGWVDPSAPPDWQQPYSAALPQQSPHQQPPQPPPSQQSPPWSALGQPGPPTGHHDPAHAHTHAQSPPPPAHPTPHNLHASPPALPRATGPPDAYSSPYAPTSYANNPPTAQHAQDPAAAPAHAYPHPHQAQHLPQDQRSSQLPNSAFPQPAHANTRTQAGANPAVDPDLSSPQEVHDGSIGTRTRAGSGASCASIDSTSTPTRLPSIPGSCIATPSSTYYTAVNRFYAELLAASKAVGDLTKADMDSVDSLRQFELLAQRVEVIKRLLRRSPPFPVSAISHFALWRMFEYACPVQSPRISLMCLYIHELFFAITRSYDPLLNMRPQRSADSVDNAQVSYARYSLHGALQQIFEWTDLTDMEPVPRTGQRTMCSPNNGFDNCESEDIPIGWKRGWERLSQLADFLPAIKQEWEEGQLWICSRSALREHLFNLKAKRMYQEIFGMRIDPSTMHISISWCSICLDDNNNQALRFNDVELSFTGDGFRTSSRIPELHERRVQSLRELLDTLELRTHMNNLLVQAWE